MNSHFPQLISIELETEKKKKNPFSGKKILECNDAILFKDKTFICT